MAPPAIVAKLEKLLNHGIASEADALYFMVEIRKLLERRQGKKQYEYLTFQCDWAVHPELAGPMAQNILNKFDAANIHLKAGIELRDLPGPLRTEIDRISKMRYFKDQLDGFLTSNSLPTLDTTRNDGWIHFLHLYARVVEDCPLVMTPKNKSASIASVTLKIELANANALSGSDVWYKVRWVIQDKAGQSGEIFVLNSFSKSQHSE